MHIHGIPRGRGQIPSCSTAPCETLSVHGTNGIASEFSDGNAAPQAARLLGAEVASSNIARFTDEPCAESQILTLHVCPPAKGRLQGFAHCMSFHGGTNPLSPHYYDTLVASRLTEASEGRAVAPRA